MSYGSRYTLDDVVQSMKKTGVGLKGKSKSCDCAVHQTDLFGKALQSALFESFLLHVNSNINVIKVVSPFSL